MIIGMINPKEAHLKPDSEPAYECKQNRPAIKLHLSKME